MKWLRLFTAVIAFTMMNVSTVGLAMTFQQPVGIGDFAPDISGRNGNGIAFWKFTDNVGEEHKSTYWKGMATFGDGDNVICYHYDIYKRGQADAELFGGQNVSDTFAITTGEHTKIFSIKTDNEIAFFEIFSTSNPGNDCYILGKSKNGNFIKYLDTKDITKRFFGTSTLQAHFGCVNSFV